MAAQRPHTPAGDHQDIVEAVSRGRMGHREAMRWVGVETLWDLVLTVHLHRMRMSTVGRWLRRHEPISLVRRT